MALTTYKANVKRPGDTLTVTFDFTQFVMDVEPVAVVFMLRGEPGLTYVQVSNASGLVTLEISGGTAGRVYRYGMEAGTSDGRTVVDTRVVRLRETDGTELPDLGTGGATIEGLLVLDYEYLLLDDSFLVLT